LSNGVELKIGTNFGRPTGQQTIKVEMARASGDSFYRIFRDQNGLAVFAYELEIQLSDDGDAVLLTAKPVLAEFAARFPNADLGKPVPTLMENRALPPLDSGGHREIGLFELEGMGLRVVDTVDTVLKQPAEAAYQASPDRMRLSGLKLKVNGSALKANGTGGAVAGKYALIYIPGAGAYVLSAEPVTAAGFAKVGTIDGKKLQFTWNNETIEAEAAEPVLGGSGAGELWVFFDRSFQPVGNWTKLRSPDGAPAEDEFFAAASDSLSWWLTSPPASNSQ
jgi:hypothetical protein